MLTIAYGGGGGSRPCLRKQKITILGVKKNKIRVQKQTNIIKVLHQNALPCAIIILYYTARYSIVVHVDVLIHCFFLMCRQAKTDKNASSKK